MTQETPPPQATTGKGDNVIAKLGDALNASGKSRYAIWKNTGVSQGQLSRLADGSRGVRLENAQAIAGELGLQLRLMPAAGAFESVPLDELLPVLRAAGMTEAEIEQARQFNE